MFKANIIVSTTEVAIPLKFIEGIALKREEEDLVVDKIKGDLIFQVCTIAGNRYDISTKHQMDVFKKHGVPDSLEEMYTSIIEKWVRVMEYRDVQ